MTRARARAASSARVVALALAVGVSVSSCTGAPAGGGHDHGPTAAQEAGAPASADDAAATAADGQDHAGHDGHDDGHGAGHGEAAGDGTAAGTAPPGEDHAHDHDDDPGDAAAVTGPPRPADPDVACGSTVLPDGEQVNRYCDEGEATFAVGEGEKETLVEGATCEDRGAFFLAHFGTNYSDDETARGEYLGLALRDMPEGDGEAPIYALELTLDGYRQQVAEATVEVTRGERSVGLSLDGALPDGRTLSVQATCHVHEG